MSSLLSLLNQKANASNRECQAFQTKVKGVLEDILSDSRLNEHDQAVYESQIDGLCADYSISINSLELEAISKCRRLCEESAPLPSGTSPSKPRRTRRHSSESSSDYS